MTEPAPYDPEKTPAIFVGGKHWPVPPLAPRQLREVWGDVTELTRALDVTVQSIDISLTVEEEEAAAQLAFGDKILRLTSEQFAKLENVVYHGLLRAHPKMSRDEFLDMETGATDLVTAFLIVRAQTGMFRKPTASEEAAGEDGSVGEGNGAQMPRQTGTA